MTEQAYHLSEAAADLAAAGLLDHVLVAEAGAWRVVTDATPAERTIPGSFVGATLDSRTAEPGTLFLALRGDQADGRDYVSQALNAGASALTRVWRAEKDDPLRAVAAPPHGVVLVSPDPRRAFRTLATHWRTRLSTTVIAVTGSNGKTTTKDFLAAALTAAGPTCHTAGNLNNELGVPLTVLDLRPEHDFAAVEMGASAVGHIASLAAVARPAIGVITNAAPAHLAEFGDLDGVIRGKGELLDSLPAAGAAILNADSPGYADWCKRARCRVVSFGAARAVDGNEAVGDDAGDTGVAHVTDPRTDNADDVCRWHWRPDPANDRGRLEFDDQVWPVPLPGRHNGANLVAAILAARAAGVDDATIRRGLAAFTPSPHRGKLLECGGRRVLDDSYNANPASMRSAAASVLALPGDGRTIAVLGHMAELGRDSDRQHHETGSELARLGIDLLVAVGEAAAPLADGFAAAGGRIQRCADRDAAVRWLVANTVAGDRLLVKGSRSAAMETIVDRLQQQLQSNQKRTSATQRTPAKEN